MEQEKPAAKVWTAADYFQLKEGIQSRLAFASMCKSGMWSVRWTPTELQAKWREVLYDEKVAAEAAAKIAGMPATTRRPRWNEAELRVFEQLAGPNAESAIKLFEDNRATWHPTRTLEQVERKMNEINKPKRGKAAKDENDSFTPTPKRSGRQRAASASSPPSSSNDAEDDVSHKLSKRKSEEQLITPQKALKQYPWEAHPDVIAILVGSRAVFEVKELPCIIGRKAVNDPSQKLHIDLSDEGDATKISRSQALIDKNAENKFIIKQTGKALTMVEDADLRDGEAVLLANRAVVTFSSFDFTWIERDS